MNLEDKVVVVTGGSKGLGRAIAEEFKREKARVIINGRSRSELKTTSKEIGVVYFVGDVVKENDVKKLATFAVKKFGKIDVWVNNVGIGMGHMTLEKVDSKEAHKVMEVNFFGTFYGSRFAVEYMKKKKEGVIINILSSRAIDPSPSSIVYSSSKWATRGFTEALRSVLLPFNIQVLGVYPSGMKTNFFGNKKPKDYKDYMDPLFVAKKIVQNLKLKKPKVELIVK